MGLALTIIRNIIATFFGGFSLNNSCRSNVVRIIFFVLFITFFEVLFYLKTSRNTKLIACGILMAVVFIIKSILYLLHLMLNTAMDLSNSEPSIKEERPEDIPPEVWETRTLLKNPKPNLDSVVSDLIASGIDANGLIRLVDYIQNAPESPIEEVSSEKDQNPVINICGRLHTLPFSRSSVEKIFPTNFTFWVLILSTIFGFSCSYLPLSLTNQFHNREKWWIAVICGTSIFSILKPPDVDPYLTFTPDSWTGLCRPLYVTILSTIWRVSIDAKNENPISHLPFYDWEINWNIIFPYIFDICRYGLLLFPFFIFYGFIGHPVSTIISILESSCRYFLGQNGIKNVLHLSIQIIRGSASVACCWGLLQYRQNDVTISASITIATFLGCIPIYFKKNRMKNIFIMFLYPFILAATSFISSYCLCYLLISEKSQEDHKQEIILWFSFAWFLLVDILYPYLSSNQRYFVFHAKLLRSLPFITIIRNFSQIIVGPLFLSACLLHTTFHPLLVSFIIIHATQKYNTEPHVFGLSVFLTVATLPADFGLENDYSANLLISLLISCKVETFLPQLRLTCHSRDLFCLDELIVDIEEFSIILYPFLQLIDFLPCADYVAKLPSLIWSFFTGCSYTADRGLSFVLTPSPPRPFYFFDWPIKHEGGEKAFFMKHVAEHPIETPVYASTARALGNDFANLARSGRLGFVNSGDIFLFKSEALSAFIHVISQEPSCCRIQVRGLEYDNQTTCHRKENTRLNDIINDYTMCGNFVSACIFSYSAYDLRALRIPLQMFDVMQTKVDQAFIGIDAKQVYELFLASFAYVVATKKEKLFEVRPISSEDEERVRPFRTSNLMLKIRTISSKRINSLNNNNRNSTTTAATSNENNSNSNGEDEGDADGDAENDNNASLNENDSIQIDNENNHGELDDEEANLAVNLWLVIAMSLFNGENFALKTESIVESFHGNPPFSEHQTWIYNSPSLLVEVIVPSIQLGCGTSFIANAGAGPDFDENGEADPDEVFRFLDTTKKQTVLTPIDSARFQKAFFNEKSKAIISLGSVKREDTVIRFSLCEKKWNVLKMNHEWIRALWSSDERDLIFFSITDSERASIQENRIFLNNMILQSADIPVGYPAFTSEIIDSYINPFTIHSGL